MKHTLADRQIFLTAKTQFSHRMNEADNQTNCVCMSRAATSSNDSKSSLRYACIIRLLHNWPNMACSRMSAQSGLPLKSHHDQTKNAFQEFSVKM